MGWDAHSSAKCKKVYGRLQLALPCLRNQFTDAANKIKKTAGTADGFLHLGSLDCTTCRDMLTEATGKTCYEDNGWTTEEVKEISKSANWDFEYDKEDTWAYLSARSFLELCAKNNLSIKFSW